MAYWDPNTGMMMEQNTPSLSASTMQKASSTINPLQTVGDAGWEGVNPYAGGYIRENGNIIQNKADGNGFYAYEDYLGADGNGKPVLGETPWHSYDNQGNYTHSGVHKEAKWQDLALMAALSAYGMSFLNPGMAGGMGGAGGGTAAMGDAYLPGTLADTMPMVQAGDAYLPGALMDTAAMGDAMLPGQLSFLAGPNSVPGLAELVASYGPAAASGGTSAVSGGMGSGEAISSGAGMKVSAPTINNLGASLKTALDSPWLKGAGLANSLFGGRGGGTSGANIADIVAGVMDYRGQKGASNDMLDYMRQQQGKIDAMYAPGSPEWNALWESMSRKDAAAGRNSQYGTRAVDFMGKVADTKAKYTADLTKGLAGNYSAAFNQKAAAPAGLMSGIKKALATPENLSSIINWISGGGSGQSGVTEWDNAWQALGGDDDFIDYGEFL